MHSEDIWLYLGASGGIWSGLWRVHVNLDIDISVGHFTDTDA